MPSRGDVYWFEFQATVGSEQRGHRPAVIVSGEAQNRASPNVVVAAVTTTEPSKPYPFIIELPAGMPLDKRGFVLCNQLRTLSKERLEDHSGSLTPVQMRQVDAGLRAALDL